MKLFKTLSTLLIILKFINATKEFNNSSSNNSVIFTQNNDDNQKQILSRKKRYLIFPTGSSFSVATCMTIGIYGNPQYSIFSWGVNWGFAYELPTNSSTYRHTSLDSFRILRSTDVQTAPMIKRSHRRDLYNKMETIMDKMGYNGRDCILRALCESSQFFGNKGSNLIAELIRTIFSFPKSKTLPFEHSEIKVYDAAHRIGKMKRETMSCNEIYPSCGFSLIKLALGHYAKPLQSYM
ncbi:hypothetical protein PVAND_002544 [Polypedilum vanderplanki]|uniref:Uncharacterized protein n=1 Tax=Polypedilum vanderplanki TaxID=319348 RepID=A0A9J6BS11_POLVA|nr:hypothetical protein PVAND_002544 [Polypedilum vanderplanki]